MRIVELLAPSPDISRIDAEVLLAFVLNQPRSFLYSHPEYQLTPEQNEQFECLCARRLEGEPIAYILGKKEFWSLELTVNKNVLIPRPETELLVEIALNKIKNAEAVIADLGTGSGAIALALASEHPGWTVIATDISEDALKLARHNAAQLQLENIEFYCGDWCDILPNEKLDAIISNPPYIERNDPHLEQGDVRFEPKIALEAGDGLSELQKIIVQAKERLKVGGFLILEHGYNQSKAVQDLLAQNGYQKITVYQDLAGIDRAVVVENN
ncbi:MAG: N5-glutamine methyltransferase, modifies release factors RF-1 and RF-2 [uncultured bacterium]|nr:MAG: N5-glutamine methyltransferase, modifies release factors RF-1 and RF-2 [uncultured bacterium]